MSAQQFRSACDESSWVSCRGVQAIAETIHHLVPRWHNELKPNGNSRAQRPSLNISPTVHPWQTATATAPPHLSHSPLFLVPAAHADATASSRSQRQQPRYRHCAMMPNSPTVPLKKSLVITWWKITFAVCVRLFCCDFCRYLLGEGFFGGRAAIMSYQQYMNMGEFGDRECSEFTTDAWLGLAALCARAMAADYRQSLIRVNEL